VLLPTGRAPLDNVLEVLAMSGIVGSHLAAELNVPAVALSRLRHDCIGSDGYIVIADGGAQAIQSKLLWGLCDIAAATPPISVTLLQGWRSWATWCYITGRAPEAHWSFTSDGVKALARTVSAYLDEQKPPLVLVRYLSGLSTADFAASLDLSRQRMHLIEGRDPKGDELCSRYLALACRKHLQHLTADSFWGERGSRIFPTETP
jgi:hypothetical protein